MDFTGSSFFLVDGPSLQIIYSVEELGQGVPFAPEGVPTGQRSQSRGYVRKSIVAAGPGLSKTCISQQRTVLYRAPALFGGVATSRNVSSHTVTRGLKTSGRLVRIWGPYYETYFVIIFYALVG